MLLQEGASAQTVKSLREKLAAVLKQEKSLSPQAKLQLWADRTDRIDLREGSVSILIRPARLFDGTCDRKLAESCTIRSEINFGRSAQGLRLIAGETEVKGKPDLSPLRILKRAAYWRERWFNEPGTSISALAKEARTHPANISMEIKLAFLAPDIVNALLDGKAPATLNAERLKRLVELPPYWSEQRRMLGLPQI